MLERPFFKGIIVKKPGPEGADWRLLARLDNKDVQVVTPEIQKDIDKATANRVVVGLGAAALCVGECGAPACVIWQRIHVCNCSQVVAVSGLRLKHVHASLLAGCAWCLVKLCCSLHPVHVRVVHCRPVWAVQHHLDVMRCSQYLACRRTRTVRL